MIWIFCACFFLLAQDSLEVVVNGVDFRQGETMRVEVIEGSQECSVSFDKTNYPVYEVGTSAICLVGIPADFPAGEHALEVQSASNRWRRQIEIRATHYPRQKIILPPEKSYLLELDITDEREIIRGAFRQETEQRFWDTVFTVPVYGELTSPYGARRDNRFHRGLDIAAERGTIVQAPAAGQVTVSQDFPIHGKTVVLDHGHGVSTVYCHLDTILVEEGEMVGRSSPVGRIGDTGYATAPHLHWGLYVHGAPVDPTPWLIQDY